MLTITDNEVSFLSNWIETIITWLDKASGRDLATSFQVVDGAKDTWQAICHIFGRDPEEDNIAQDGSEEGDLLLPTLTNLEKVHEILSMPETANLPAKIKSDEDFLRKLADVFIEAE